MIVDVDFTEQDTLLDMSFGEVIQTAGNGSSGSITQETDPTVPDWAKQKEKPTYTADEVGAIPVPPTASVGQTIVVTEVDEDGKPTAWEAADLPSGGGGDEWKLVESVSLSKNDNIVEINTGSYACKKLRFIMKIGYGATITAQVKVNNHLIFKNWYYFQDASGYVTNFIEIEKTASGRYRLEATGNYSGNPWENKYKMHGATDNNLEPVSINITLSAALAANATYMVEVVE